MGFFSVAEQHPLNEEAVDFAMRQVNSAKDLDAYVAAPMRQV
jgi:hypothetical protein